MHVERSRTFALVLGALLLAGVLGSAAAAPAVPQHVSVIKATQMDILRNGQPSGRFSLAVGTALDVDGVEGDFLLIHIRLLKGRVPAVDTDYDTMAAAPEGSMPRKMAPPARDTVLPPPVSAKAPPPKAPSPIAALPAKPVAVTSAPVSLMMDPRAGMQGPSGARRPRAAFSGTVVLCMLAFIILMIAAHWRLYTKAGKPGWASIVPIYNMVVYLQMAGKPVWWLFLYFVPLVNLVVSFLTVFALADKFGKGKGFALGMIFLPFIFVPILAFGDDAYLG